MREACNAQASVFDRYAKHEIGNELAMMSEILDNCAGLIDLVQADLIQKDTQLTGRVGLPVDIPQGAYLEATFENPSGGVLTKGFFLDKRANSFIVQSPPVTGLKAGKDYNVRFHLYETESKNKLIDSDSQKVRSGISN